MSAPAYKVRAMNFDASKMLSFDLETTSVNTREAKIVTSAVIRIAGRDVVKKETLADPGVEIPEAAAKIHGITTEKARAEGRPHDEVLHETVNAIKAAWDEGFTLIVYNAPYDLSVLRNLTGDFSQGGNPIPTAFLNTLFSQQDAALMRRYDDEFGAEFQDFAAPHYLHIHDYDVHRTLSVYFPAGSLRQLLESSPELKSKARQFAVTLMRYRKGNLFQRWHSSALTQRVYSHIKAQST